jgi:hypothetical protein
MDMHEAAIACNAMCEKWNRRWSAEVYQKEMEESRGVCPSRN